MYNIVFLPSSLTWIHGQRAKLYRSNTRRLDVHKHNKHPFLHTTWSLFFPFFALAEREQKPKEAQKHIEEELQLFPLAAQVTMQAGGTFAHRRAASWEIKNRLRNILGRLRGHAKKGE